MHTHMGCRTLVGAQQWASAVENVQSPGSDQRIACLVQTPDSAHTARAGGTDHEPNPNPALTLTTRTRTLTFLGRAAL